MSRSTANRTLVLIAVGGLLVGLIGGSIDGSSQQTIPGLGLAAGGSALLGAHAVLALALLAVARRGKAVLVMKVALVVTALSATVFLIWRVTDDSFTQHIALLLIGFACAGLALGLAVALPGVGPVGRGLRWGVMLALGLLLLDWPWVVNTIMLDRLDAQGWEVGTFAGVSVLIVVALLLQLIWARLHPLAAMGRERFELTCPRCRQRQHLTGGGAPCAACGLEIAVRRP